MKNKKHDVKKQTNTKTYDSLSKQTGSLKEVALQPHVPISIEEQLESFADLLIDHFLNQDHDEK